MRPPAWASHRRVGTGLSGNGLSGNGLSGNEPKWEWAKWAAHRRSDVARVAEHGGGRGGEKQRFRRDDAVPVLAPPGNGLSGTGLSGNGLSGNVLSGNGETVGPVRV